MEIVVPKQYLSKWDKLRDKIECIIVRIKMINWYVKDYESIEKPKNEALEYINKYGDKQ
jgi:uncharacterized protein YfkK (UPF0435 family)